MFLHQIFLTVNGSKMSDFPNYTENSKALRLLNPDYDYLLWDDSAVATLLERLPAERNFVAGLPHKFYVIDFVKYLVLREFGGLYVDMDENPLQPLPRPDDLPPTIIGTCQFVGNSLIADPKDYVVNNNLVRLPPALCRALVDYAQIETTRVRGMAIYKTWRGRALKQSVGVEMFKRFCKQNLLRTELDTWRYFSNQNSRAWECLVRDKHSHFKKPSEK